MQKLTLTLAALLCCITMAWAQEPDPNFYIYLCFGQSNMEGNGQIEQIDRTGISDRFQMMAAVNYDNPKRQMYNWYTATPPLVRQYTGLCPADWFGRTMVDNLPDDVRVGVIVVAVGGASIRHLDKDFDPATLSQEADWFRNYMMEYNGKPYDRLVECAKEAQKHGVIKGMLLHQGETDNGQQDWPKKVNKVYTDLLADLSLNADDVPLFVGETVRSEMGGYCGMHNGVIANIAKTIPTAHVVSAANLPNKGDGLHFTSHSYRVLGCRYATEALKLMGINDPVVSYSEEIPEQPKPNPTEGDFVFDLDTFNPSLFGEGTWSKRSHTFKPAQWGCGGWEFTTPLDLSGYHFLIAELEKPQTIHAQLRVWDTPSYWDKSYERDFDDNTLLVSELNGMMKNLDSGIVPLNSDSIYRVGIWAYGGGPIVIKQIFATNNDPYNAIAEIDADGTGNYAVFNLSGMKVADDATAYDSLPSGIYIVNGTKLAK